MSTVVADPIAWPLIGDMVACLEQQVGCVDDPPAVVSARPGDRIELLISEADDECCNGLAWVRLVSIYPSSDFPGADTEASNCGPRGWAVVLEIGVARCAPTPDTTRVPTAEEWTEITGKVMADAAAIRRTVLCFKTLPEREDTMWLVGGYTPLPTEGGCVGGSMQVTVHALACDRLEACS